MVSYQLQNAELFRLHKTTTSINYFCLYHFSRLSDSTAFDSGDVMAQVRDLSNTAPGRSSIEIVRRTQYERVLHRRWPADGTSEGLGGAVQASLLAIQGHKLQEATRWLNDVLYALHLVQPLQCAQVYATKLADHTELFVLLRSTALMPASSVPASSVPASPVPLPLDWHMWASPYAQRPSLQLHWQAQAECVAQWLK